MRLTPPHHARDSLSIINHQHVETHNAINTPSTSINFALPTPNTEQLKSPYNTSDPTGLLNVETWSQSDKYALGWTYFCLLLLCCAASKRFYLLWTDKMRLVASSPSQEAARDDKGEIAAEVDAPPAAFSPCHIEKTAHQEGAETTTKRTRIEVVFDITTAMVRYIVYRTIPNISIPLRASWRPMVFPSLPALIIISVAFAFVTLYCFVPRPLYWEDISHGSPPVAIRAGMIAVAMLPWLIALSMKANLISVSTGMGHERLNVLHRWGGWICLFLGLVHTVPFFVTPVWETDESRSVFAGLYQLAGDGYVYGSGEEFVFECAESLLLIGL